MPIYYIDIDRIYNFLFGKQYRFFPNTSNKSA